MNPKFRNTTLDAKMITATDGSAPRTSTPIVSDPKPKMSAA